MSCRLLEGETNSIYVELRNIFVMNSISIGIVGGVVQVGVKWSQARNLTSVRDHYESFSNKFSNKFSELHVAAENAAENARACSFG